MTRQPTRASDTTSDLSRTVRATAALGKLSSLRSFVVPLLLITSTAACGGSGSVAAPSTAATASIQIEIRMPNFVYKGQQCVQPPGGDLGENPFHDGADWELQDQDGVILAKDDLAAGVPDGKYCNSPLNFANVQTTGVKMYVLRNKANDGWKLMPTEIASDGPTVIDYFNNPPEDL